MVWQLTRWPEIEVERKGGGCEYLEGSGCLTARFSFFSPTKVIVGVGFAQYTAGKDFRDFRVKEWGILLAVRIGNR